MTRPQLNKGARYVSTDEAQKMMNDAKISLTLDVRTPGERKQAFINGTATLPLDDIPYSVEKIIGHKKKPVLLHCHTHHRSAQAANFLVAQGFCDIRVMEGGIKAWIEEGKPLAPQRSTEPIG